MKKFMIMSAAAAMSLTLSACQTTGMSMGSDPIQQKLNQAAYVDETSSCGEIKMTMSNMTDVVVAADNAAMQQSQANANNRAVNSAAYSSGAAKDIPFLSNALQLNSNQSSAYYSKMRQQGQMARREKNRLSQAYSKKNCDQ